MPQKCPYWNIFGLPNCRLHQSQIPNVLPGIQENDIAWNIVKREAFYVVDALESASCVLENHLVTNHQKTV